MKIKIKSINITIIVLVVAVFVIGAILYQFMPGKFASHWNSAGEVDGYMGKFWGVFMMPFIMLGLFLLYLLIPKIDPLKTNINLFRKYYNAFWIFLFIFLSYVFCLTLAWNFGYRFNFTVAMVPAMSILLFFIGSLLGKLKRNWFIGIRTPWTLSSDVVWEKTHKLGGKLFKISAVISLLGLLFKGSIMIIFMIFPVIVFSIYIIIFSYLEYKKLNK